MDRSQRPSSVTRQDSVELTAPPSTPVTEASQPFFGHQVSTITTEASTSGEHLGKGGRKFSDRKLRPPSEKSLKGVSKGSIKKRRTTGHKRLLDKNQSGSPEQFVQAVRDSLGELSEQREGTGKLELSEIKKAMDDIQ